MQAERPLLLQDLSSSRLLAKFKQESASPATSTASPPPQQPATTSSATVKSESPPAPTTSAHPTPPPSSNASRAADTPSRSTPSETASIAAKRSPNQGTPLSVKRSSEMPSSSKPSILNAGIYGIDALEEAGVYGADIPVVPKGGASSTSATVTPKLTSQQHSQVPSKKNSITSASITSPLRQQQSATTIDSTAGKKSPTSPSPLIPTAAQAAVDTTETNSLLTSEVNKSMLLDESVNSGNLEESGKLGCFPNDNTVVSFSGDFIRKPGGSSSRRKPAFNPLHVILKDKNKYHTTEYI
jgi:hypothetical protein